MKITQRAVGYAVSDRLKGVDLYVSVWWFTSVRFHLDLHLWVYMIICWFVRACINTHTTNRFNYQVRTKICKNLPLRSPPTPAPINLSPIPPISPHFGGKPWGLPHVLKTPTFGHKGDGGTKGGGGERTPPQISKSILKLKNLV